MEKYGRQKQWPDRITQYCPSPMQHLEATEEHILILSEDWRQSKECWNSGLQRLLLK